MEPTGAPEPPRVAPQVTRKTTSVLFGDLVGFTSLSESRDVEDVRELLSRYFQLCRTVILRYGGTVEKFIGDAVMAVWGVPAVHEDDAERAVRAGLELTSSIAALGEELGLPTLQIRVGVVTGEVAVTEGATGEGMVAGDAVNTAARVQSQAPPGRVWVDALTRDLASSAVAFASVGELVLKGRAAPLICAEAVAVVAAVGGAHRMDGLTAPLTGRTRELSVVTELFHATAESQQPRLLVVSGAAGVGKTRLGAELRYYLDGLSGAVWWHQGRCPAYGDSVAFWALTEALRARFDIAADADVDTVDARLDAGMARHVSDGEQRRWLGPRLATLLGGSAAVGDLPREDLFSAWIAFFQALSVSGDGSGEELAAPVVLVVDDAQHADDGLLDFLEQAVERGRFALFVVVLSRPELVARRPDLGSGRRRSSLHLEPLPDPPMQVLVDSLVADLSDAARRLLVRRSEGIPLFALETVRWLIDLDAVQAVDGRYVASSRTEHVLGDGGAPVTIEAVVAARLDALDPAERGVLTDAAVLGAEFDLDGLTALGRDRASCVAALSALVGRDLVRPVEHGDREPSESWVFAQAVIRSVTYGSLSRADRRVRHLAVAEHLTAREDPAGALNPVIAQHLLDAVAHAPEPGDASVKDRAVDLLRRGAQRAVDVGAPVEGLRLVERALEALQAADERRPFLEEIAASALSQMGDTTMARGAFERAIGGHEAAGRIPEAARSASNLSWTMRHRGQSMEALRTVVPWWRRLARERSAWPDLSPAERERHESAWLLLLLEIGAGLWAVAPAEEFADLPDVSTVTVQAIGLAERRNDRGALARGLNGLALELDRVGAVREAARILRRSAELAEDAGRPGDALGALSNLSALLLARDLAGAREAADHGVVLGRGAPIQPRYEYVQVHLGLCYWLAGSWAELRLLLDEVECVSALGSAVARALDAALAAATGTAPRLPARPSSPAEDPHIRAYNAVADELGRARPRVEALADAAESLRQFLGVPDEFLWSIAVDAALEQNDLRTVQRLVEPVAAGCGELTPLLSAQLLRLRGALGMARRRDLPAAAADLEMAVAALDEYGAPFYAARARLSLAAALFLLDRPAAARLHGREAADAFAGLEAAPWHVRARLVMGEGPPVPARATD